MGTELRPKGITQTHLRLANIPQDYWGVDFWNYEGPERAAKATIRYLQKLDSMKTEGVGVMYIGPFGPGKTTLAMIAMKYLLRANWSVYVTSLGEIVENIQKSWHNNEDEAITGFLQRCRGCDFLLIDDVGKEHRGGSGFVSTVFDNLIRYRVQHRYPTFLTTNHTKSELEATYGGSIISLLEGKVLPIAVVGDDHRRTVQKTKIREDFKA